MSGCSLPLLFLSYTHGTAWSSHFGKLSRVGPAKKAKRQKAASQRTVQWRWIYQRRDLTVGRRQRRKLESGANKAKKKRKGKKKKKALVAIPTAIRASSDLFCSFNLVFCDGFSPLWRQRTGRLFPPPPPSRHHLQHRPLPEKDELFFFQDIDFQGKKDTTGKKAG